MRKAQIEVMGLVVVVVVILFAAILFLRIYLASDFSFSDDSFLLSAKANNLANTIKGLDVCNSNMQEAIIACCIGESFCGREACGFVSEVVSNVVNLTFSSEGVNLLIKDNDGRTCVAYEGAKCAGSAVASSPLPIKGSAGSADVSIKICKK